MSHSTQIVPTWSWLRSTSRALYELDNELPPISVEFPWKKLEESLKKCFGLTDFSLEKSELHWKEKDELIQGLQGSLRHIPLQASGIEGALTLLLPEAACQAFQARLLQLDATQIAELPQDFSESFFHFAVAETLFQMNTIGFQKLAFSSPETKEEPFEQARCQDFFIHLGEVRFPGRLLISPHFEASFYNALQKKGAPLPNQRLQELQVVMHVLAGRSALFLKDLVSIRPGDFLSIDQIFYDPEREPKICYLTVSGRTLFRAEVQPEQLIIQEIPSQNEVNDIMPQKLNMDNDPPVEDHPVENQPLENGVEASADEDAGDLFEEELDAEEEQDDYELQEGSAGDDPKQHVEEHHAAEEAHAPKPKERPQVTRTPQALHAGHLTLNDISVTVGIELAQIEITAQKLIELQPGSMLDLQSDGKEVLLTVNGKIVGKGELIKIGTTLGVRILELGVQ